MKPLSDYWYIIIIKKIKIIINYTNKIYVWKYNNFLFNYFIIYLGEKIIKKL